MTHSLLSIHRITATLIHAAVLHIGAATPSRWRRDLPVVKQLLLLRNPISGSSLRASCVHCWNGRSIRSRTTAACGQQQNKQYKTTIQSCAPSAPA